MQNIAISANDYDELMLALDNMTETIRHQHDELQGLRRVMQRRMRPLRGAGVGPLVRVS